MELHRLMSIKLALFSFLIHIGSCSDRTSGACCLPDQLSGQVTISPRLRHSLNDRKVFQTPIEFSVDFSRGLMFGEHRVHYPHPRHVQFVADIRNEVHYIRERNSNRCWKLPIGRRMRKPCSLDQARYRGSFFHNGEDSKRNGRKLIYDRSTQSANEYFISWLKFRSLLVVEEDTCLPVLDAHADDLDYYIAFHNMKNGLGRFREFWKDESDDWQLDDCGDSMEESSEDEDTEADTDSYRLTHRRSGKDSERKRWLRLFLGIEKNREKEVEKSQEDDMNRILQLDIYLYLLRHFFPRPPPEPCCGPKQWQASVTKTITYTYIQSNYVGQSTTSMPHLYVDHTNGRMATDIVEYVNGAATSNISLLALFGQNNSNSVLSIYAVDWKKSPVACTYIQVTDVQGPMRNNCMPSSAQFEHTIRLGSGPFNSIRLDAYNVSGSSKWGNGQLDYSAESYVVPHECMPIMEVYNWKTANTKVSGSLLMSNTRTSISDPTSAFQVPTVCQTTSPVKLTSTQIQDSISYALSYVG